MRRDIKFCRHQSGPKQLIISDNWTGVSRLRTLRFWNMEWSRPSISPTPHSNRNREMGRLIASGSPDVGVRHDGLGEKPSGDQEVSCKFEGSAEAGEALSILTMLDTIILWNASLSDDEKIQQSVSGALPRTAASFEVSNKSWVADSHSAKSAGRNAVLLKIGFDFLQ